MWDVSVMFGERSRRPQHQPSEHLVSCGELWPPHQPAHTHICMHTHTCTRAHHKIHKHTHTTKYTHHKIHKHTTKYTNTHTTKKHTHTHTDKHTNTTKYTHTQTHTHTYTLAWSEIPDRKTYWWKTTLLSDPIFLNLSFLFLCGSVPDRRPILMPPHNNEGGYVFLTPPHNINEATYSLLHPIKKLKSAWLMQKDISTQRSKFKINCYTVWLKENKRFCLLQSC